MVVILNAVNILKSSIEYFQKQILKNGPLSSYDMSSILEIKRYVLITAFYFTRY